jgi:hypothetical protein
MFVIFVMDLFMSLSVDWFRLVFIGRLRLYISTTLFSLYRSSTSFSLYRSSTSLCSNLVRDARRIHTSSGKQFNI